jgi:hypothetical protein
LMDHSAVYPLIVAVEVARYLFAKNCFRTGAFLLAPCCSFGRERVVSLYGQRWGF